MYPRGGSCSILFQGPDRNLIDTKIARVQLFTPEIHGRIFHV